MESTKPMAQDRLPFQLSCLSHTMCALAQPLLPAIDVP